MSRRLRTTLPSTREQRKPSIPNGLSMQAKNQQLKVRQKENFDTHHGIRELSPLQPGETVWMTDRNCEVRVSEEVATRSYEVTSQEGIFRRNRRDLYILPNPEMDQSVAEHPQVPQQLERTLLDRSHCADPHVLLRHQAIWTQAGHNVYLYLHLKKGRCSVSCFVAIIELRYGGGE